MFHRSALRISLLALVLTAGAAVAEAATVELISRATPPPDSNGRAGRPAVSADGRYVAFLSDAPNLVPGQVDDNFFHDVFLHDRVTGTTTLVSHTAGSPNRAAPVRGAYQLLDVQISADGRYVAFTSLGTDLVPNMSDGEGWSDVFFWDRVTDTTTLVSHSASHPTASAGGLSYGVQLSADGRYVAFTSRASDLVAGQNDPGAPFTNDDVFLWERDSNTTTLVSRKSGTPATAGDEISSAAGISADGGIVLFTSRARDLLPNGVDTFGSMDVFLYQRSSGVVTLVSHASGAPGLPVGAAGNVLYLEDAVSPVLSSDGRYVAFASRAANLVPGQVDDSFSMDAFLFDRVSGQTSLASRASTSPLMAGGGIAIRHDGLDLSGDGRFVAFVSRAANLVPGQVDTNQSDDVFVYDRITGATALASHTHGSATTATAARAAAGRPSFSGDGRFLVFTSEATDLVAGQTDRPATADVFLYETSTQGTVLVSRPRGSATMAANGDSTDPVISADGGVVAFASTANDLGEGQADPNGYHDVFLYHRPSAEITSASHRDPGRPAVTPAGPSTLESLSADGRFVVFSSRATGLVPGQIDVPDGFDPISGFLGTWDVFLRDLTAGTTTLLSRSPTSRLTAEGGMTPTLSADGRFAAFVSSKRAAGGLYYPLYLYDRAADTLTLVNHSPGSQEPEGFPQFPVLSADGRYLAYQCYQCGLVPGHPAEGGDEIFLYDRVSGLNTLVSHASGSATARSDGSSLRPGISADGRFVSFVSRSTNLVPGQADDSNTLDLFVFDRTTGAITLVSRPVTPALRAAGISQEETSLSADGRFLAFLSSAPDLVPGQVDTNGERDLFLHDRVAGRTVLVSHKASSPVTARDGIGGLASDVSMSADGRFVVYASGSTDLVAGVIDPAGTLDLFLYDRLTGTNTLVSRSAAAPGRVANDGALAPRISADGSRIAFLSSSTDLIPGQTLPPGSANLFVRDRIAGTTVLVGRVDSPEPFDPSGDFSYAPIPSANGRRVAFISDTGFTAGDLNGQLDVYLWKDDAPTGPIPLPPCKLLDTRRRADRPVLTSDVQRTVAVRGACGVPATAKQVVVKVTVFNSSGKGNLRFYPGAVTAAPSGILRFERGATRTETFTLPLGANGGLTVLPFVAGRGTVHGVLEVTGYLN